MARPFKEGLDYFPLDVDIDQTEAVQVIEADYGLAGFSVFIKLLTKIYKSSYYIEWTEISEKLFAKHNNVEQEWVSEVVNACINIGLFDRDAYRNHDVLTSRGIQKRFIEATSRREAVTIQKNICLLPEELLKKYPKLTLLEEDSEVKNCAESVQCTESEQKSVQPKTSETVQKQVNDDSNGINVDSNEDSDGVHDNISTQSKVKESKVEDRRYIRVHSASFEQFWNIYPKKVNKSRAKEIWLKIKPEAELLETIMDSVKKQSMSPEWRKDGGQYVPHATTWLRGKRWEDEVEGSVVVNPEEKANSEIWQKKTEDMVKKFTETGEFW